MAEVEPGSALRSLLPLLEHRPEVEGLPVDPKALLFQRLDPIIQGSYLGRALGHFIFALIGLKRILPTNIFQRL